MKSLFALGLLGILALATLLVHPARGSAMQGAGPPHWVGCWFAEYEGDGLQQFITVNSDGTWFADDHKDLAFGLGDMHTTIHGVWEMIGPFEIALTGFWFVLDANGEHTGTIRAHGTSTADMGYERVVNDVVFDLYLPGQDLLNEPPFLPGVAARVGVGRKVHMVY